MAREELISSAISFLSDPSVASSPLEKRIAFLQSKNLTQDEINIALSRVGEDPSPSIAPSQGPSSQQQSIYRPPPQAYGGYGYPQYGQWQPPPELPKRDWRDWFIMATVVGGVGYGLYFIAKRYITPLIAPPTPPQLEQDKAHIDEEFSRAFALIDQLSTDTSALKSAEESRTERLDATLKEVENVIADLKTASRRRDDDVRRMNDEVKSLKDAIPKALQGAREGNENRLRELGSELRSLKLLLGNRLGGSAGTTSPGPGRPVGSMLPGTSRPADESSTASTTATNGTAAAPTEQGSQAPITTTQSTPSAVKTPLSQLGRSATIPAWQMAAANRSKNESSPTSTPSATVSTSNSGETNEQQQSGSSS